MKDALKAYRSKRDFNITPEPAEGGRQGGAALSFVVQKHWASSLHYDFRLELDGVMVSWAVPKGPSFDPHDKRMAMHVEDHPISYNSFEGAIPAGQYGAGKVIIWDKGQWHPLDEPRQALEHGELKFTLEGHKLHGKWVLVRMKGKGGKQEPWLLIKEKDQYARPASEFSVVDEMPDSVGAPADAPPSPAHQPAKDAANAANAPKSALPATLAPQLATLAGQPPSTPEDWEFEIKFDGYRLLARIDRRSVRLLTRNGKDWTHKLAALQKTLRDMQLPPGWYDGEIVVHDDQGRPDFGLLQNAFDEERTGDIIYFVFDLPFHAGRDLRGVPLEQRRAALQAVLESAPGPHDNVRFSATLDAPPGEMLEAACRMGLEGIIGKRKESAYVSRRNADWIKLKCGLRQEFVIGGYTDPQGSREGFGSLLLGTYDAQGALRYVGNVGTGFDTDMIGKIAGRLAKLAAADSPFGAGRPTGGGVHWVRPELLAEVRFGEWTRGGAIRHAVFEGLREDKPARDVTRERAAAPAGEVKGTLPPGFKISHADRLIDPDSGTTKIGLVRYYALVGALMLPHLKGRPVSLVRAPSGVGGELFFQKHAAVDKLPGVKLLDQALDPGHPPMLEISSQRGLLSAAQWNVIELHTQNASAAHYDKPNRMVFDLDPGKGVTWPQMREAGILMRAFLTELGLPVFLKTSGGKGLHLVVPLRPGYGWDTVKAFSQAIVAHMAEAIPERFALKSGPRNRIGKIYIDYLRNGRGSTTVCAWSARVRPGLGISVPVAWEELERLHGGDHWTVATVHRRLDTGNTPWDGYAKAASGLAAAMRRMRFKPARD